MEICIFFFLCFLEMRRSLWENTYCTVWQPAHLSSGHSQEPGGSNSNRELHSGKRGMWMVQGSRRIFLECCVCDRKISRSKKGRSRRSVLLGGDRAHFVPARCQLDIVLFGITLRFDTGSPCGNAGKGPCFSVWYRKTCFYSRVTPKKHRLLPPTAAVLLRGGPSTWRVDGR